jgi:hypothetical protein
MGFLRLWITTFRRKKRCKNKLIGDVLNHRKYIPEAYSAPFFGSYYSKKN